MERGKELRDTVRRAVYQRGGDTCGLCGGRVDFSKQGPHPFSPSVDHILPRALGGTDDLSNLQLAHLGCNARKGARVIERAV